MADLFYPDPILEDLIRSLAERIMIEVEQSTSAEDMYLQHDLLPLFTRIRLAFETNDFLPLSSDIQAFILKIENSIRPLNHFECPECLTLYIDKPTICEACGCVQE